MNEQFVYSNNIRLNRIIEISFVVIIALVVSCCMVIGKNRTWILILYFFMIFPVIMMGSRFWMRLFLFALIINMFPLSFIQSMSIFRSLTVAILILISIALILQNLEREISQLVRYDLIFVLFGLWSFAATFKNHEIHFWMSHCITPLLFIFLLRHFVRTTKDALLILRVVLISLCGYILFYFTSVFWGDTHFIGFSKEYTRDLSTWGVGARFVTFGPLRYALGHNMQASLTSLIAVLSFGFLLSSTNRMSYIRFLYGGIFVVALGLTLMTSARAITGGLFIAIITMLILTRRIKLGISWIVALSLLGLYVINSFNIIDLLGMQGSRRIYELQGGAILDSGSFISRIDMLKDTAIMALSKPFGIGFNYYEFVFGPRREDSILFSNTINGTGLIGFLLFQYICIKICLNFIRKIKNKAFEPVNQVAIIGIGTLILVFVGGLSQRYLFSFKIYSFMVWAILAACYCATSISRSRKSEVTPVEHHEGTLFHGVKKSEGD